jgi:hypothetical protein
LFWLERALTFPVFGLFFLSLLIMYPELVLLNLVGPLLQFSCGELFVRYLARQGYTLESSTAQRITVVDWLVPNCVVAELLSTFGKRSAEGWGNITRQYFLRASTLDFPADLRSELIESTIALLEKHSEDFRMGLDAPRCSAGHSSRLGAW